MTALIRETGSFRWENIPVRSYKEAGAHFSGITRQVLFGAADGVACELRYFEIQSLGYSSLERHRHAHVVMIVRGAGRALVGREILELNDHDLVRIPPLTWHQFRAGAETPLGFLCMVDCERDQPEQPDAEVLESLRQDPEIGGFIRV